MSPTDLRRDPARLAAALLLPGAVVFALRAAVAWSGHDPSAVPALGPLTAAGGVLSLIGVGMALWGLRLAAAAGAACVLVGHFVVSAWAPGLGPGLVYLGTGLLVARRDPTAAAAGAVAMAGALLRDAVALGHGLVALGAAWLALELLAVARSDMHASA